MLAKPRRMEGLFQEYGPGQDHAPPTQPQTQLNPGSEARVAKAARLSVTFASRFCFIPQSGSANAHWESKPQHGRDSTHLPAPRAHPMLISKVVASGQGGRAALLGTLNPWLFRAAG